MPHRPDRRLPKYRHYRPKDLAVVRIDGHDRYLGRYGSEESKREYRRLIAEWLAGSPGPRPKSAGPDELGPTVSELILGYVRWADRYYVKGDRPTSEPANIRGALRPLRKLYGTTPALEFGPLALKAVRQAMVRADLCRNEVNKRIRHVVRLFRWAVENELVPAAVHQALKAVPGLRKGRSEARESAPVRPVPDDRVEAIRAHVAPQVWAMAELQRLTGMRPGEVVAMRGCDLDRSGPTWSYRPRSHKTEHHGRERTIFLGPRAQEALGPWLRADQAAYLFSPREAAEAKLAGRRRARRSPMTPSQRARRRKARPGRAPGESYLTSSYAHAIARGCDRAFPHPTLGRARASTLDEARRLELKAWRKAHRWHPNQLRHNAATRLRREYGLDVARAILGHSSPAVTEAYAEADRAKAEAVMREIG